MQIPSSFHSSSGPSASYTLCARAALYATRVCPQLHDPGAIFMGPDLIVQPDCKLFMN